MTPGRLGAILAVVVLAVDQAVKAWILHVVRLPDRPPIRVGPFFDLVMVWNRGISYGLFQQHEDWGRWALVGLSIAACIGLSLWLGPTRVWINGVALGL